MTEGLTLRVRDRRELRRALTEAELNHDELWDADQAEIGEAILRLAIDNPDLLRRKLDEVGDER